MSKCHVVERTALNLLYTNLATQELSISQFLEGTSYPADKEVQNGENIYRALKENPTEIPTTETKTLEWKYLRKANYMRAFDKYMYTKTISENGTIVFIIEARFIDIVAFFGLKAKTVKIEMFDINDAVMTNPIRTYEQKTSKRDVHSFRSHVAALPEYIRKTIFDVMPHINKKLRITITNGNSRVEVGNIVFGRKYEVGVTLSEPKPVKETVNIYKKEKDAVSGDLIETPSILYQRLIVRVILDNSAVERTENKFDDLNGKIYLFVASRGSPKRPPLMAYGMHKDFRTPIGINKTIREITFEGVT